MKTSKKAQAFLDASPSFDNLELLPPLSVDLRKSSRSIAADKYSIDLSCSWKERKTETHASNQAPVMSVYLFGLAKTQPRKLVSKAVPSRSNTKINCQGPTRSIEDSKPIWVSRKN